MAALPSPLPSEMFTTCFRRHGILQRLVVASARMRSYGIQKGQPHSLLFVQFLMVFEGRR